jgi:predicted Zn-dependent protease
MSKENPTSDSSRASYSKEEQLDIYALAKMCLETGHCKKAEIILKGLTTVVPDFVPGWLALSVAQSTLSNIEAAHESARRALKVQPSSPAAIILLVTTALALGDKSTAGTYLGELKELIDQGIVNDPNVIRLFKMQMVRYHGQ